MVTWNDDKRIESKIRLLIKQLVPYTPPSSPLGRDLSAEIDELKARIEKLEKKWHI